MIEMITGRGIQSLNNEFSNKNSKVGFNNLLTGEWYGWEYPPHVRRIEAKAMLIAAVYNPVVINGVAYSSQVKLKHKGVGYLEHCGYIQIDPVTRRASVTDEGKRLMGPVVRKDSERVQWASLRPCDLVQCDGAYLAQRVLRHSNIVHVVMPTGEGWAWKHPDHIERLTAKAMLLVKVYEPELVNGKFFAPHRIRDHGCGRIFSGAVAAKYAMIGSDGYVRLTETGEGFFRCVST